MVPDFSASPLPLPAEGPKTILSSFNLPPVPPKKLGTKLFACLAGGVFSTLLLVGCGSERPSGGDPRPPQILPLLTSRERPQTYNLHDPSCQNRLELSNNPLPLTTAWVRQISVEGLLEQPVSLLDTQTQLSLRSSSVIETTYGELHERVCDFRKPKQNRCRDNEGNELPYIRKVSPKGLKICKDAYQYPRDSYEGVALTSLYGIDKTYRLYESMTTDESQSTPQVSLSVLPTFEELYDYFPHEGSLTRYKTYLTHNLAYFPDAIEIVVFPESLLARGSRNLWESSFVLSHEYGHHIDHVRHGSLYRVADLRWSPFPHRFVDVARDSREELALEARRSDEPSPPPALSPRSLLITSLSEAFADLIAFYSQGESGASLSGFSDIGVDRDVSRPKFASRLPKILEKEYVEVFFAQSAPSPYSDLAPMTGVHTIGAIFAYGTNLFLTQIAESSSRELKSSDNSSPPNPELTRVKYKLLLVWMKSLAEELTKLNTDSTGDECLKSVAKGFNRALDQGLQNQQKLLSPEDFAQLRGQLINQLNELFPAMDF